MAYNATKTWRMSLCTPVYLTVLRMVYLSDASRPHGDSVPGNFFRSCGHSQFSGERNEADSIWQVARTRIEPPVAPVSDETNLSTLSMKDSAKLCRNFDRTALGTAPALGQGHAGTAVTACPACLSMNTLTTGRKIGSKNKHSPTNAVGSTSPTLYRVHILRVHGSQDDWESRLDIRKALSSVMWEAWWVNVEPFWHRVHRAQVCYTVSRLTKSLRNWQSMRTGKANRHDTSTHCNDMTQQSWGVERNDPMTGPSEANVEIRLCDSVTDVEQGWLRG